MKVFTIGHSNHPLEAFRDLLLRHAVQIVVDARSSPYSQYCSHFNRDGLSAYLKEQGIEYRFLGDALGGRAAPLFAGHPRTLARENLALAKRSSVVPARLGKRALEQLSNG